MMKRTARNWKKRKKTTSMRSRDERERIRKNIRKIKIEISCRIL